MQSPPLKPWLIRAALTALPCLASCNSTKDALAIMRCDQQLQSLVTQTYVQKAGPGAFACLRADALTKADQTSLREHCAVGHEPTEEVIYPARPLPMIPPKWWALRDGENVSYASLISDGGAWQGLAYRKKVGAAEVWFMCAGWL